MNEPDLSGGRSWRFATNSPESQSNWTRPATGRDCACATALESAVITRLQHIPEETRQRLSLFLDKYIKVKEEVG